MTSAQKDELMDQVKQQIAIANTQAFITVNIVSDKHALLLLYYITLLISCIFLLQKVTDKCFKKCVGKPGTDLDSGEQKCLAMCMDRYMDTINVVSRAYTSRLQRERNNM